MKVKIKEWLKRTIPFLCVAMVLVSMLAVPAKAADTAAEDSTDGWISVMDYNPPEFFNFTLNPSNGYGQIFEYDLPDKMRIYSFDILVYCTNGPVKMAYLKGDEYIALNTIDVGGHYYRCVGNAVGLFRDDIHLAVQSWDGTYRSGSIVSFNITFVPYTLIETTGGFRGFRGSDGEFYEMYQNAPNELLTIHRAYDPDDNWHLQLFSNDWYKFDYLDYVIELHGVDITSISAEHKGQILPFEHSTILNPGTSYYNYPNYTLLVRVDLTGIKRAGTWDGGDYPMVFVDGISNLGSGDEEGYTGVRIDFISVTGSVLVEEPDSDYYWYSEILTNIRAVGSLVWNELDLIHTRLTEWLKPINGTLTSGFQSVVNAINAKEWKVTFGGWFSDLGTGLGNVVTASGESAAKVIEALGGFVGDISSAVSDSFTSVVGSIGEIQWFKDFSNSVSAGFTAITDLFTKGEEEKAIEDDVAQDIEDIGTTFDKFEELERPEVDIEVTIQQSYMSEYYLAYISVIQCFWELNVLTVAIVAMCVLFIISALLFGKLG